MFCDKNNFFYFIIFTFTHNIYCNGVLRKYEMCQNKSVKFLMYPVRIEVPLFQKCNFWNDVRVWSTKWNFFLFRMYDTLHNIQRNYKLIKLIGLSLIKVIYTECSTKMLLFLNDSVLKKGEKVCCNVSKYLKHIPHKLKIFISYLNKVVGF